MDYLNTIDQNVLLAINGWHSTYFDQLMWCISSRLSWSLILVAVLVALRRDWRQAILVLGAVILTVAVADQVSSGLIKHLVARLRPTHDPNLASVVHLVNGYRGGQYGFVSSHAANSFGVALLMGLIMRHRRVLVAMMLWAAVQCYSRMYLGVHFPGDIIGGVIVGLLTGWLVYHLWNYASRRWLPSHDMVFSKGDAMLIASSVYLTLAVILLMALFI